MTQFKLQIETINAAFEPDARAELARILREVAETLEAERLPGYGVLFDANGNSVGTWEAD